MSLLSRYVLKEWSVVFALTMGAIVGIFILQSMMDRLPDLLRAEADFRQICLFFALTLPTYVPAITPIAFLISLLVSLGKLHRNNEIVAMRSVGRSLFEISRPLWAAGLSLSLGLFYLTAMVVPETVERSRSFFNHLAFSTQEAAGSKEVGWIDHLGFDNRKDGRLWFMNRFNERAWQAVGVNVHTRSADGRELGRISAAEAYFDDTQGHWVFIDGRELIIDAASGDPLRTIPFERRVFEDFREDPDLMLALYSKPEELSLDELRRVVRTFPPEENPTVQAYLVRLHSLVASPFVCLVVTGIAVPFAVSGVRTNPMIGVFKCLGYFAAFYLLVSVATIMGEQRAIPFWLAAWLPNAVMLLVALWLFRQAR